MIALHGEGSIGLTTVALVEVAVGDVEAVGAAFCDRAFVTPASQGKEPYRLAGTRHVSETKGRVCRYVCVCVCHAESTDLATFFILAWTVSCGVC